jgi:hypothetical protein
MSSSLSWHTRLRSAKMFADAFNPHWISLQYVPFGYHLKGLPFNLGERLKQLGKDKRWHIMFHELSVNKDESLKFRAWAFLQVGIIRSLLQTLQPHLVTTNTELYRARLLEVKYEVQLLPLFSNISRTIHPVNKAFDEIIPEFIVKNDGAFIIGTLFGSFDFKSWDIRSLLDKFLKTTIDKRLLVVSIGRMSAGNELWENLQDEYPHVLFIELGMQEKEFISYWLSHYTDFGILTSLPELAGKSGSFMAFKEHGLPVVCKEETPELEDICKTPLDKGLTMVHPGRELVIPDKKEPVVLLEAVADQFINYLLEAEGRGATVDNPQSIADG